jgi:flagellar motor switch/type III secretory pathway protein FliN
MSFPEVLDRLGDLPFPVEVELGGLPMAIREILDLKIGAVIPTGRRSGTPFTLRAGGEEIAEVEFVTLGDSVSVRVLNLIEKNRNTSGGNGTD